MRQKGTFYKYTTEQPNFAWAKALFMQDYYPSGAGAYTSWNIPANTALTYSWRANDLYDPDYTSGSATDTSIYWAQQFYQQFRQFCVYGSKIVVTGQMFNFGATNQTRNRVYLWPGEEPTSISEASIMLNPYAQYRELDPQYQSGNGGHFKIKAFAKTKKIMGRKVDEGFDPSGDGSAMGGLLGGTGTGASPTSLWYWNMRFCNGYPSGSGIPTPLTTSAAYYVNVRVKITYYVKLFNRVITSGTQSYGTTVPA